MGILNSKLDRQRKRDSLVEQMAESDTCECGRPMLGLFCVGCHELDCECEPVDAGDTVCVDARPPAETQGQSGKCE